MTDNLVKRLRRADTCIFPTERERCHCGEAADRILKLEAALQALAYIHDGNPSDAMAGVSELDYARHMLWEARQIARKALEEKDD